MEVYGVLFFDITGHFVTAYGWGLVHLIFFTYILLDPSIFFFQPRIALSAIFFCHDTLDRIRLAAALLQYYSSRMKLLYVDCLCGQARLGADLDGALMGRCSAASLFCAVGGDVRHGSAGREAS